MGLFVSSLNSGSNGNCYYVGNSSDAVLVDIGISCREVETRMKRAGLDIKKIRAIFISHEHTDHIKGVELFSKKHQVPVYITTATRRNGRVKLEKHLSCSFTEDVPVAFGDLLVTAFRKFHDAVDPYSFIITSNKVNVGVFTDIGRPCDKLVHHFKQCHAAFLESNYDDVMLQTGGYPYYLKKRITGGFGHLSNDEALQLFRSHRPLHMTHLFLSHLSHNNNCPNLVKDLFEKHAEGVKIVIASRTQESDVFNITGNSSSISKTCHTPLRVQQLQLSF